MTASASPVLRPVFFGQTPLQRTGLVLKRAPSRPRTRRVHPKESDQCRSDLILISILVIFLLGGFSGRFGGYGYGHGGIGIIGVVVIILVVLLLIGRL